MFELSVFDFIGLLAGFTALVPSLLLIRQFYYFRILEYALLSLSFFTAFLIMTADYLAQQLNMLIFYQIHHWAIDMIFITFFLHGVRYKWKAPPKLLLYTGIVWYIVLFVLTALWQIMEQPESIPLLFWSLPHTFSTYFPNGAGFSIDGMIIYSTAFRYLGEVYRIFVLSIVLYAYLSVKLNEPNPRVIRARRIWLTIWILFFAHSVTMFHPFITELNVFFLLIAGGLLIFLSLFIPEALLISKVQLNRAVQLYDELKVKTDPQERELISREIIKRYLEYVREKSDDDELIIN